MKDELGDRMKSYYENRSKTFLARRTPVIIRLDGKAFHTFTRGFNKPFDEAMCNAGQAHFSHKQLEGLNSNQIQELLFQEKGINWNDYPTKFKRGSCCIKKYHQTMNQTLRSYWFIDNEIPIFKGEDREYIEKLIA